MLIKIAGSAPNADYLELSYIENGMECMPDLMGNVGELPEHDYDESGKLFYTMSQGDYDWWKTYADGLSKERDLREEYIDKFGSDAYWELKSNLTSNDMDSQTWEMVGLMEEALDEDININEQHYFVLKNAHSYVTKEIDTIFDCQSLLFLTCGYITSDFNRIIYNRLLYIQTENNYCIFYCIYVNTVITQWLGRIM